MTNAESLPFLLVRRRAIEEAPPSSRARKKMLRDAPPPSDVSTAVSAHAPARRARVIRLGSTVILENPSGGSSRSGTTEVLLRKSVLPKKRRGLWPVLLLGGLTLALIAAYLVMRLR
jgi:hypothetical protein